MKQHRLGLSNTRFDGKGLSLIPSSTGNLKQALFVTEQPEQYFACGALIQQLPEAKYVLQAKGEYKRAIAFGWMIGAYDFDRYKSSSKKLATLAIDDESLVEETIKQYKATALVRDLVNTPAADMDASTSSRDDRATSARI